MDVWQWKEQWGERPHGRRSPDHHWLYSAAFLIFASFPSPLSVSYTVSLLNYQFSKLRCLAATPRPGTHCLTGILYSFTFSFRYSVWTELRARCLWEAMLDPPKPRLHPPLCASSHSTPCCLNLSQCIGDSETKPECFWILVVWPQAESSYSKNCQQGFKDGSGIGRSIWFQEKSHCWVLLTMLHYQFIFLEIAPHVSEIAQM